MFCEPSIREIHVTSDSSGVQMVFKRLVLAVLVSAVGCSSNFIVGDFVPAARKGQYHGVSPSYDVEMCIGMSGHLM
jgi:hypothetical protein